MRIYWLIAILLAGLVSVPAQTNRYPVRGVVQAVMPSAHKVRVQHEAIPGYMMAMTMNFNVQDTNCLATVRPGDKVTFTLVVTPDDDWVENLQKTGATGAVSPPPVKPSAGNGELKVGDALPAAVFTDETGCPMRLTDFTGRAVAFTFFFTRCPLPDYCPRMNRNFADARKILEADTNGPANWQFVSVSFDAKFDGPEVMRAYGALYRGADTNGWRFASADSLTLHALAPGLDFHYWSENGTLSHNLRTVVLAPNGRIAAFFDGNDWTPADLASAMKKASGRGF